ncbi:MAG: hypothetical protein RL026_2487 [Pseudomonadota bacterium]|jgi:diguanylate cyclase (GGDEF)-like protein
MTSGGARLPAWSGAAAVFALCAAIWVVGWNAGDRNLLPDGASVVGVATFLLWMLAAWLFARVAGRLPEAAPARRIALLAAAGASGQSIAGLWFSLPPLSAWGHATGWPLGDLFLFASYLAWVLALVLPDRPGVGRDLRWRLEALDVAIALAVLALLNWYYLIEDSTLYEDYGRLLGQLVEALYLVFDFALLLAVVAAWSARHSADTLVDRRGLIAAAAVLSLADMFVAAHLYLFDGGYADTIAVVLQQLALCILIGLGLQWEGRGAAPGAPGTASPAVAPELRGRGRQPARLLTPAALLSTLALFCLLIIEHWPRPLDRDTVLTIGASLVAMAILARQILTARSNETWLLAERQKLEREVEHRSRELEIANGELRRLARQDALSGLGNRRAFDEWLAEAWREAGTGGRPLALVMIDIDAFKAYNDALGHLAGDACLRRAAAVLVAELDRHDHRLARYGGEEFALLLPGSDVADAVRVIETLRSALRERALPHPASPVGPHVTFSAGVASHVPGPAQSADGLVEAADRALYLAKTGGRDRVATASVQI